MPRSKDATILVIDDDRDILEALREVLEREGRTANPQAQRVEVMA